MSVYMAIKNIEVMRMNTKQSSYLHSPTPVFACVSLGHKIGCDLNCNIVGTGMVHHNSEWLIEEICNGGTGFISKHPVQFRGTPSGKKLPSPNALSLQPTITANITISLIFKIQENTVPSINDIYGKIKTLKISGGIAHNISKSQIVLSDNLNNLMTKINNGFWIEDATEIVSKRLEEGYHPVDAVFARTEKGWYVPANLGYCVISNFKDRKGGRKLIKSDGTCQNVKIAYADNMVGLVKYKPIFEVRNKLEKGEQVNLWHFDFIDDTYYIVRQ